MTENFYFSQQHYIKIHDWGHDSDSTTSDYTNFIQRGDPIGPPIG